MSLDPAALARSLRLPPSALRIVDLSALSPGMREIEFRRLAESGTLDLPPRLRLRVEPVGPSPPSPLPLPGRGAPPHLRMRIPPSSGEGSGEAGERGQEGEGSLDWLVFAPGSPLRVPKKVYASPLEYWADRVPALPPAPALPVTAPAAPLRRRMSELDAETWRELRARAAWEGLAPAAMLLAP